MSNTAPTAPTRGRAVPAWVPTTLSVLALTGVLVASLLVGARTLPLPDMIAALPVLVSGLPADASLTEGIVAARWDRTVVGCITGVALAAAGTLLQGVTRNPLADSGTLGMSAGAALAMVVGIRFFHIGSTGTYMIVGFCGAFAAALLIQLLTAGMASSRRPLVMILLGAVIGAGTSGITSGLLLSDAESLDVFRFWQVGTVSGREWQIVLPVLPAIVAGLIAAWASAPTLNVLALGDDLAHGVGVGVGRAQTLAVAGAALLCASATAIAGPVGFVGLVVPHVVRFIVGHDYRKVLVGSMIGGPLLVVAADTVGRIITPPSEVAVGIATAVVGAPVMLGILARMGRS